MDYKILSLSVFALLLTLVASASAAERTKPRTLKLAGLVVAMEKLDIEGNTAKVCDMIREAAKRGAKIVCTPEGALDGYCVQTKGLTAERFAEVAETVDPPGPHLRRALDACRKAKVWGVIGFTEKKRKGTGFVFYNAAALVDDTGKIRGLYYKTHNLNDEPLNTVGDALPVFDTPFGRLGIMICYDRQPPETARLLALRGAELILNPAAGSYGEENDVMMRTRARENGLWIIFAHFNDCLIISPDGKIAARFQPDGDRIVTAEIDLAQATRKPLNHRRPELYGDLAK